VVGGAFFAIQLYGDFSGYSDIALGTARLFGFRLARNFNYPFFSRSITEFWQRWHISLSTWFRDYVAIPLIAHRNSKWVKLRVTFILFLLIGLWHGANWTFVAWGLLNALLMTPSILRKTSRNTTQIVAHDRSLPTVKELLAMAGTFSLSVLTGIFFRSENIGQAFSIIKEICSASLFSLPHVLPAVECLLIAVFFMIEWAGRRNSYAIETLYFRSPAMLRRSFYMVIALTIIISWQDEQSFIYFQF
jgi:alginate O-acetyltransferase complex protein AlgI